jgi:hypothetical protein
MFGAIKIRTDKVYGTPGYRPKRTRKGDLAMSIVSRFSFVGIEMLSPHFHEDSKPGLPRIVTGLSLGSENRGGSFSTASRTLIVTVSPRYRIAVGVGYRLLPRREGRATTVAMCNFVKSERSRCLLT